MVGALGIIPSYSIPHQGDPISEVRAESERLDQGDPAYIL